jgi:hypothetical protein
VKAQEIDLTKINADSAAELGRPENDLTDEMQRTFQTNEQREEY